MMNWQNIDTVLLDMDGTLLDLHFDNYFWLHHLPKRYAEAQGIDELEAKAHIHAQIQSLEGSLQWYCLDHWSALMHLDVAALKHEVQDKIKIRPYAEDFLARLRQLGKQLILITNSHRKGLDLKMKVTAIDQWLDSIISSHDFNSPKEDTNFWRLLLQQEPFDKQRALFIDDTPRVLRSAQHFGIRHLLCITEPDSMKPRQSPEEFIGIDQFSEIMPEVV